MTTEQKAQAYDEAVDRMKIWAEGKAGDVNTPQQVCEYIFPELAGRVDNEKIREGLVKMIQVAAPSYIRGYGIGKDDVLAWLEKQKPIEWSEEDEKNLKYAYASLINACELHSAEWLLSLKERIVNRYGKDKDSACV